MSTEKQAVVNINHRCWPVEKLSLITLIVNFDCRCWPTILQFYLPSTERLILGGWFFYLPSSGIASCVGTVGTVTSHLHLTRPCCVALRWVLIWGLNPDWLRSFVNWVSSFPVGPVRSKGETRLGLIWTIMEGRLRHSRGPAHSSHPLKNCKISSNPWPLAMPFNCALFCGTLLLIGPCS